MGNYCTLFPFKKDVNTGELKESKLFKDLLSLTNSREATKSLYFKVTSPSFTREYQKIEKDELGEPKIESLLKNKEVNTILNDAVITTALNKKIDAINKDGSFKYEENTYKGVMTLYEKVNKFNEENTYKDFIATIKQDNSGLYVEVERKNKINEAKAKNIKINYTLNKSIETLLANKGITINRLTKLEESIGIGGKVDYKTAEYTAEGLIGLIKLANNETGVNALPEEFAHFAVDINSDNPLVRRLFTLLSKNPTLIREVLGEEYEEYTKKYSNNEETLIREVAGKLIYQSWFLDKKQNTNYQGIISRVINSIKEFIRKTFKKEDFIDALTEAQSIASDIGKFITEDIDVKKEQLNNLKKLDSLYNLQSKTTSKKEILTRILSNEIKKYDFYRKSLQDKMLKAKTEKEKEELNDKLADYIFDVESFILEEKENLAKEEFDIGIVSFIQKSFENLSTYTDKMKGIINSDLNIKEAAYQLNTIKIFIDSIYPTVRDLIAKETFDGDLKLEPQISSYLHSLNEDLGILESEYKKAAFSAFSTFLKEYFPEEGIKVSTKEGKKVLTKDIIDSLLETAKQDITIIDRYIQSAANTNDLLIQIVDAAIKEKKDNTRTKVQELKRVLVAKYNKLKEKGLDDSFMFERHKDGSMSGRYISNTNWTLYYDTLNSFKKELYEKYKRDIEKGDWKDYNQDLNAWYRDNTTYEGDPSPLKYSVDIQKDYNLSDEQLDYYNTFMQIRVNMLSKLPPQILSNDPMLAVQMQKDLYLRLKETNPKEWWGKIREAAKQSVTSHLSDTNFGSGGKYKNFDGSEKYTLPIFFTSAIDESNLNRDTVSTMLAFADMAINYEEMSDIVDILELGRTPMNERVAEEKGNETIKTKGIKLVQKIFKTENNNFVAKYNELLETQLYGRYLSDASVQIKNTNINLSKVAGLLNKLTALNSLALNALAAIAAVGNDIIQVNSEVAASMVKGGKAYFDAKSLYSADKYYRKNILKVIGEFGEINKTNKLGLFLEKFDVLHNYENDIFNYKFKTPKVRKLLSENSLYFLMSAGAHWGESRTALAQAMYTKVKTNDGKEISLWDALEVKTDENGEKYLGTIDGVELTREEENNFKKRVWGVNHDLYGIYNKADKNALQKTAIGALIMMFRKYIVPALNRKYGGITSKETLYNFDTAEEHEGYYVSLWKFIYSTIKDSKDMGLQISLHWDQMEDFQKSNIARALNELITVIVLTGVTAALTGDKDKKDNPWGERLLIYMSRRLKTEIKAFTPFGVTRELGDIIASPMAATRTLESIGSIKEALYLPNWFGEKIESGRFKGKSKGYRALMNSPFVPMNKTIYRLLHPEIAERYFNK